MEYYLVLLPLAFILIISKAGIKLCEKIKLPSVVGMLLTGILINLINYIPGQNILNETEALPCRGASFLAEKLIVRRDVHILPS